MRLLIVTTRNIYEDGGEKSYMIAKDKFLRKLGVETYYYSFRRDIDKYKNKDPLLNIIAHKSTYSLFLNRNKIIQELKSIISLYKIDILVISGSWLYLLVDFIKEIKSRYNIPISLDFQGVLEEIKEYNMLYGNKILSLMLYKVLKNLEKKVVSEVDGIETVSRNAINYLKQEYLLDKNKPSVIIPCGIDTPFSNKDYLENRKLWRRKLGFHNEDLGFVYAGGIQKWQRLDDFMQLALKNSCKNFKFFIFTPPKNWSFLRKKYSFLNSKQNVFLHFLPYHTLKKALCAFDAGVLFRYEDKTNFIAFPNKFSEYINARLLVLMKSKKIGCWPPSNYTSLVEIITGNKITIDVIKKIKNRNLKLYEEYINFLSYENTVKQLVKYYEKLLST